MSAPEISIDMYPKPEIFETAFINGTKINQEPYSLSFFPIKIGDIKIETGKIIACDPILMHSAKPFLNTFPIGEFPVELAIAEISDQERTSFARIKFSESPVEKWEFALKEGQTPMSIFGDSVYCFSVDACTAIFIDEKANAAFNLITEKDRDMWEKAFFDDIEKQSFKHWFYNCFSFDTFNLASFSTGLGDGHYATYVGTDKNGNISRLLTDFNLVNW